jgi:hypothetical protein
MTPLTGVLAGALIGATAALGGTALQLWASARQRERERHMQLRRDVYLEAAAGLAAFLDFLNQYGRADVPLGKAALPPGAAGWLFKAYLVASTDALVALNQAGAAVGAAALDILGHRLAVSQAEDDIAVTRTAIDDIRQLQQQLLAEARSLETAIRSEQVAQRQQWIVEQYQLASDRLVKETQQMDAFVSEHGRRLRVLLERLITINVEVQQPVRSALLAARSDLEFPIDRTKFDLVTARVDMEMSQKVRNVISLIEV